MTEKQRKEIIYLDLVADITYQLEINIALLDGAQQKIGDSGMKHAVASFVANQKMWKNKMMAGMSRIGISTRMQEDLDSVNLTYYSQIMEDSRAGMDMEGLARVVSICKNVPDLFPIVEAIKPFCSQAQNQNDS